MKRFNLLAILLVFALVLSACSPSNKPADDKPNAGNETQSEQPKEDKSAKQMADDMHSMEETVAKNEGTALPAGEGTLKIAYVSSSPFKGLFNIALYQGNDDLQFMQNLTWVAWSTDKEFKISNDGPLNLEYDKDAKTVTIKIHDKYTWNDGTPVTAKDLQFVYELIGHGDYTGPRFQDDYKNVVGIEEYHWGTMSEEKLKKLQESEDFKMPEGIVPAKEISGVKIIDDKTLQVTFKNFSVDILWGGGIPTEPIPYHQLKDIPVAKLEESDEVRLHPLSCGPYYINNVVPGESVEYKANPYFFKGEAKIPTVIMQVLSPDKLIESMKAGEYDLYKTTPVAKYADIKDLPNYDILKKTDYSYSYIGFKLGKWDAQNKVNVYDSNAKMADLNLRSAMEMAIDPDLIGQEYYHGLRYRGATIIPTVFKTVHNSNLEPIKYDMEAANKILDDAGYKDVDGDGKREKPDGSKLEINVAMMAGTKDDEEISQYYMNQWIDLGLDVKYTEGRLLEFNHFYDLVEADNENIDVFFGAWSTGTNPEPYGLYGESAQWNFSRFVDPDLEVALKKITDENSFDEAYRKAAYDDVQKIIYDKKPVSILHYRMSIYPVNKRIKEYDISVTSNQYLSDLELLADEPIKAN